MGTTLGKPDTIKILHTPLKVVEIADSIVVLDQESDKRVIKYYSLDGFFIKKRPYIPDQDSMMFEPSWVEPDPEIVDIAYKRFSDEYGLDGENWIGMIQGLNNMIWLVGGWGAGDAGGTHFLGFDLWDETKRVYGREGPYLSYYHKHSMRSSMMRLYKSPFYFHVGAYYIYLITMDYLWQYNFQGKLVRKIGIEPEGTFKEPYGVALDVNNTLYINDFRLGKIWRYNPRTMPAIRIIGASEEIVPEAVTYIIAEYGSIWSADILHKTVKNMKNSRKITRSFSINKFARSPGTLDFEIALCDSFVFIHVLRSHEVIVYDTLGRYVSTIKGTNYKSDRVFRIDNEANVYFFQVDKQSNKQRYYRLNPIEGDTFELFFPDTFQYYRLEWYRLYRYFNKLYVFGKYQHFYGGGDFRDIYGFFVFDNDTLTEIIEDTDFEGKLSKYITDFIVNKYGAFWVVDIEKRLVQEYIPIRFEIKEYHEKLKRKFKKKKK